MRLNFNRVTKHLAIGFVVISAVVMGYIVYELEITKRYYAEHLIEVSSERAKTELDDFFFPINNIISTIKQQHEYQIFEDFDQKKLNQFFIPVIDLYPQVSSVGIANTNGYEIDIYADSVEDSWINREVYVDEWGMVQNWSKWVYDEEDLKQTQSWQNELKVDPRDRPWYKGAMQENGRQIYWTEPYLYLSYDDIGVTASILMPSYNDESVSNILALDISNKDLTNFTQNISITPNSQLFILTSQEKKIMGLPQDSKLNPGSRKDALLSTPS